MVQSEADRLARAALVARQGAGARYDAANAPLDDLLLARRGTAYFARKLSELRDAELFAPTSNGARIRAETVARVSYSARRQAMALEAIRCRRDVSAPDGQDDPLPSLDLATTLPAHALRHLFQHSQIHLNVCWRDLAAEHWDLNAPTALGTNKKVRDLPRLRASEIWHAAIDLGNGGQTTDIPQELL